MDLDKIRNEFPALTQKVNGHDLIYFDNAATTLKPISVIESISDYYKTVNSNVHRAGHYLSSQATNAYESARKTVRDFIGAHSHEEIIFTKGTTESMNLIATILDNSILKDSDSIILTTMEHHSNIVPWLSLKEKKNLDIKIVDINSKGELDLNEFESLFSNKTKVLSIAHSSNVLGTINPIKKIIEIAKKHGVITIIDGAQGIVHDKVNVEELDCDFYCFSGHKIYGPMGIGVLYGRKELLDSLGVYQTGGGMIKNVSFESVEYNVVPYKYEAGTPNVAGAIGLEAAITYMKNIGFDKIVEYENELLDYANKKINEIEGIEIYGTSIKKDPIISFNIKGIHHSDIAMILDKFGIAVRNGSHCTQPLMKKLGIKGNIRISFVFYNTKKEIDVFIEKLIFAINMLK